jgi:hypothetical protein
MSDACCDVCFAPGCGESCDFEGGVLNYFLKWYAGRARNKKGLHLTAGL